MGQAAIEGGCVCGAVRYRAAGDALARTLCHCETCRRAAGAPSVAWVVFAADGFEFSNGEPSRFQSSPKVTRTFCSRCGTSLTYQRDDEADTIDVTTASLDAPNDFGPTKEIWTAEKLVWESVNETLRQYPGTSRQS